MRYEQDETAQRRCSAVPRPQREIASPAAEMPPSTPNSPNPTTYRTGTQIQLNMSRA